MAVVKPSVYFNSISGKLGGHMFTNGRNGLVLQPIGIRRRVASVPQAEFISLSSKIVKMWGSLSELERIAWQASSDLYPQMNRIGELKPLTGFNWFVKCVGNLYLCGLNYIPTAPGLISITPATSILVEPIGGEYVITNNGVIDGNCLYVVFSSPTYAATKGRYTSTLRVIRTVSPSELNLGVDILPEYLDIYGRWIVGQKITTVVKAINVNSGVAIDEYWIDDTVLNP